MTILCLDTSGPIVGVAVLVDDALRCEIVADAQRTHSQTAMPLVERALELARVALADVDLFAAVAGPGSFTGVRIGVSSVKGMAQATGKPCVAVDALEALALNGAYYPGVVCPILDARAGQVYAAAFSVLHGAVCRQLDDDACRIEAFIARAKALSPRGLFVGDGVAVHADAIRDLWPEAEIAPPYARNLRAGCAAEIARRRAHEAVPGEALTPLYLRAPQAVREKRAREAREHA